MVPGWHLSVSTSILWWRGVRTWKELMYFQCLFLLIYSGGGWFSSMLGAGVGDEGGTSFVLLDFLDFFFFFFFAEVEVDGGVTVLVASSPASGGDCKGVKVWAGSAAVQESVSEVEVMERSLKPKKSLEKTHG